MTQNELKKLSRADLVERLLEQTKKASRLETENMRLKERITEREHQLTQTGALAATALKLSGTSHENEAIRSLEQLMEVGRQVAAESERESKESSSDEDDDPSRPTAEQLEKELTRLRYRKRYAWSLRSTVYALITVAAAAVLIAVLVMPVLQIYGSSMNPVLQEGDLVASVKSHEMQTGDLIAFYYNNKVLVKRVIGSPGDWINIDEAGNVTVNGVVLEEEYRIK